jgi:hypothetical protein
MPGKFAANDKKRRLCVLLDSLLKTAAVRRVRGEMPRSFCDNPRVAVVNNAAMQGCSVAAAAPNVTDQLSRGARIVAKNSIMTDRRDAVVTRP